jgi:hypothetical protein
VSYRRVKGEAAETILIDEYELTEEQAGRMLATAHTLGRVNFPIKDGWDLLGVKYAAGWFFIGPPDMSTPKKRGRK